MTTIDFLGTSSCRPDLGNDTASFILNRVLLVDTGWNSVENIRKMGVEPETLPYLYLTHLHHDHYLSMPSVFFYHLCVKGTLEHLAVIGPEADIARVVKLALDFLQMETFYPQAHPPRIIPLKAGDRFETEDFALQTTASLHPVPGFCTRFMDKHTGTIVGFSGDTAYQSGLGAFYNGCDILLHESSLGPRAADSEENKRYLHSGALDAARVAREAGVKRLVLLHGSTRCRSECIAAARNVYAGDISWPERGCTYMLS